MVGPRCGSWTAQVPCIGYDSPDAAALEKTSPAMTRTQALCVAARRIARRLGPLYTGLPPDELLDRQNAALSGADCREPHRAPVDGLRRR